MAHASDSYNAGHADGANGLPPNVTGYSDPLDQSMFLAGWAEGNAETLRELSARLIRQVGTTHDHA